ncbi:MAG: hypothetical protein WC139_07255, partial [Candidatus Kapaibacterium sp.]
ISVDFFAPEGEVKANRILYFLADGDLSKLDSIKKKPVSLVYEYYYLKRIENLNKKLIDLEQIKKAEN